MCRWCDEVRAGGGVYVSRWRVARARKVRSRVCWVCVQERVRRWCEEVRAGGGVYVSRRRMGRVGTVCRWVRWRCVSILPRGRTQMCLRCRTRMSCRRMDDCADVLVGMWFGIVSSMSRWRGKMRVRCCLDVYKRCVARDERV